MMKKKTVLVLPVFAALLSVMLVCVLPASSLAQSARLRKGTRISVLGDSISTYAGWSDLRPITDESCTYRYGEAYYGPAGGDYHNTDLLVSDTWWHQAAAQMGGSILVSNAANSSGLLHASYPANEDWQQYLQDMLAYKTRPYHLGIGKAQPDIIALYIGSNDAAKVSVSDFGSVDAIDFSALIQKSGKKSYTYAEPKTVAEAYCILLHKLRQAYPKAEIYCFAVVPNAGGYLSTVNKRLASVLPFNEMVKGVARHYGAYVVDLLDAFALDPDGDGMAIQSDLDVFQSCFHNDPHPNAAGFDVIADCFVSAVLENSRHVVGHRKNLRSSPTTGSSAASSMGLVDIETTAGVIEQIEAVFTHESEDHVTRTTGAATDVITPRGLTVNFASTAVSSQDSDNTVTGSEDASYTSLDAKTGYWAEGGWNRITEKRAPLLEAVLVVPEEGDSAITIPGSLTTAPQTTGDPKSSSSDGVYDYTQTRVLRQGSLTVQTHALDIIRNDVSDAVMRYIRSDTKASAGNDMIENTSTVHLPQTKEDVPPISPGYQYVYIGSDQLSEYWAAYVYTSADASAYAGEAPFYADEDHQFYLRVAPKAFYDRNLLSSHLFLKTETVSGTFPGWYDSIQQFTLCDAAGTPITAYCADQKTPTEIGHSYTMQNVSDASYYTAEEAAKIRIAALNGYWGTASGFGSLASVKEMMADSGKFTDSEIASLTDGLAMTATQYAIWTFSNKMDEMQFINTYFTEEVMSALKYPDGNPTAYEPTALLFKLYHHLLSLTETATPETDKNTQNTVITEKNFMKDIRIRLTGKPAADADNLDADPANDVYLTDLSFALDVRPLADNDDNLTIVIEDASGNPLCVGRLAGALKPGEQRLSEGKDGRYTFSSVELSEGQQSISLVLKGTQNLKKDVYLLTSEVKSGVPSQTMVTIAEGQYGVNVQMDLLFDLDVQDDILSIHRFWRTETPLPSHPQTGDRGVMPYLALLAACACAAAILKRRSFSR